ncbi:MAG: PD40 domain-containing protein [Chloroflexi bacterium]|nr:PD40 domain-containing protein [Chloroflexota bacterium]
MSQANIQELLKKGIEAAREGNKAEARSYFEQVVELDEQNERGWFWLASLVESQDEKRICLKNVLQINPGNERAQKLLDQIEASQQRRQAEMEVIPGVTRRQLTLAVGGGAVVVALILIVFVAITTTTNNRIAQETRDAALIVQAQTDAAVTQTALVVQAEATMLALVSPTPTPTVTPRVTLPPTFTFTPLPEEAAGAPTPLAPPPPGLGTLVGWSGRDVSNVGFLPIMLFQVGSGQTTLLTDDIGANPDFSSDGQTVIYTRYYPTTFDFGISRATLSGGENTPIGQGLPFIKPKMPYFCPSANILSFVAIPTGQRDIDFSNQTVQIFQVFTLNLDTNDLQRLTNDQAVYTYPAISPDCTRIAAVRNDARGSSPGEDLVIIDVAGRSQTPLTNDLGNFIESAPRWSPDGTLLAYAAAQATSPDNSDIIVRAADGAGTPLVPIRDVADDRYPVFSPDGRYIAFASNRTGFYNIFIYDQVEGVTYQLTNTEEQTYPGGWKP